MPKGGTFAFRLHPCAEGAEKVEGNGSDPRGRLP